MVRRLVARGEVKKAVKTARRIHRQLRSEASEALLVGTYGARIEELSGRGNAAEARALAETVRRQFPSSRHLLEQSLAAASFREGDLSQLLRPLAEPALPAAQKQRIEELIKKELTDLSALAACEALPGRHPLRVQARLLRRGFEAVTRGEVSDQELALTSIPRRSPLASWKLLLRAIAAFYRDDSEVMQRSLRAVESGSVPARLLPALRAMTGELPAASLSASSHALLTGVCQKEGPLNKTLRTLEDALSKGNHKGVLRAVATAVGQCKKSHPEVLDRLRQSIEARAAELEVPAERLYEAMGGPAPRDSRYWHLFARSVERHGDAFIACRVWEEFRRCSLEEGRLRQDDPRLAVLYVRMADRLSRLDAEVLEEGRRAIRRRFCLYGEDRQSRRFFRKKAAQKAQPAITDWYFLYPERLYERACAAGAESETFSKWLAWARNNGCPRKEVDRIATQWHAAFPRDLQPLLRLMQSAERRKAFQKALNYLESAERLDPMDPEVRSARGRLLGSIVLRHLRKKKLHLAEKDLAALEGSQRLPLLALRAATRCLCQLLRDEPRAAQETFRELTQLADSELAASLVLDAIARHARCHGLDFPWPRPDPRQVSSQTLVHALARSQELADELNLPLLIPDGSEVRLKEEPSAWKRSLAVEDLRRLAELALQSECSELAYAASGAGLEREGPAGPVFLFLRARSFPAGVELRFRDCLRAALSLARQSGDHALAEEIIDFYREAERAADPFFCDESVLDPRTLSISFEKAREILQKEKESSSYPEVYVRPPHAWEFEEEEEEPEAPDLELLDFPPAVRTLLLEAIRKYGTETGELPSPRELKKRDRRLYREIRKAVRKHAEREQHPQLELF